MKYYFIVVFQVYVFSKKWITPTNTCGIQECMNILLFREIQYVQDEVLEQIQYS